MMKLSLRCATVDLKAIRGADLVAMIEVGCDHTHSRASLLLLRCALRMFHQIAKNDFAAPSCGV